MKTLIEYVYYRIAKHFYRKDGVDAFRAVVIVSAMQMMLIFDIATLFVNLFAFRNHLSPYLNSIDSKVASVAIGLPILLLNYFYFKGKYWKLSDKWRDKETSEQHTRRGWLVVLTIFTPLILFIVLIALGEDIQL